MDKPIITGNTIMIPSDLEYLAIVDEFVEGILRGFGANESIIADIAISVSELINNSVDHGSKSDCTSPVTITVERDNGKVTISIADEGTGFNPDDIANPLDDENLLKDSGRGIFIVQQLMDEVDVKSSIHGTTTTISKKIN